MNVLLALLLAVTPSLGARLPYIIGGNDAAVGAYPWQGSLRLGGSHSCGCSLISDQYFLTAAHCILLPRLLSVQLGVHDLKDSSIGNPVTYNIEATYVHPDWDMSGDGFPNDIAVGKLVTKADISSEFIGIVDMAPYDATDGFSDCVITGWGATRMGIFPTMPDKLQEGEVGIYTKTRCEEMLSGIGGATINEGHICVGEENEIGACSGDSGGPLVCTYKEKTVQVGLTSWGVSTCNPKYPSVYTRISYFRDWVDGVMNPE